MENEEKQVETTEQQETQATETATTIAGNSATAATGDAEQTTAESPATNTEPAEAKPEEIVYDFKDIIENTEGFAFDEAKQGEFAELIKGSGISNEKAGEIVKYGMKLVQGTISQVEAARNEQITKWGEEAKTALGAGFDKTVALVGIAVEHLERDFPGIRAALNETGAGNRIEIIRAFEKMGQLLQGDPGMATQAAAQQVNDLSKTLYPKTDFSRYV